MKFSTVAIAVVAGYLLYRILRGSARLLYLLCKIAVLLPIALIALVAGDVQIRRQQPLPHGAE
jgi:hypothetical protein